jgi:hypothetical protein
MASVCFEMAADDIFFDKVLSQERASNSLPILTLQ